MTRPAWSGRKSSRVVLFFFFNDTATTEIYTLSLHDALPISSLPGVAMVAPFGMSLHISGRDRSEEHTSELQSRLHLVCRLLLEKKNRTLREILAERPNTVEVPSNSAIARSRAVPLYDAASVGCGEESDEGVVRAFEARKDHPPRGEVARGPGPAAEAA